MANVIKALWNGTGEVVTATLNGAVDGVNTIGNTLHVTAQTTGIMADMADMLREGETPLSKLMADAIKSEFNDSDESDNPPVKARRNISPTETVPFK